MDETERGIQEQQDFPFVVSERRREMIKHHTLVFVKGKEDVLFVKVLAQLIREGLDFNVHADFISWEIELTGGY